MNCEASFPPHMPGPANSSVKDSAMPRYDWHQTYDWNFDHAPEATRIEERPVPGNWDFCGLPVASPLGIAAGPLLNGKWILYYAALGFDALTYKTVRSRARACYPLPNLQPVAAKAVHGGAGALGADSEMQGTWAVSFGMPSKAPEYWRRDVEATRRRLPKGKVLSVSVVATPEDHWTADEVADDFACCARWAVESGADCVEANFSCPNVASADGQLYQQPGAAGLVAARLRKAVGSVPLLIKVGHVVDEPLAAALTDAVARHASALVMVNCVSAAVVDADRRPLFDGQKRGIAGAAIREAALEQIRLFSRVIRERGRRLKLVGVGGVSSTAEVRAHLAAGSHSVQLATAAMLDPQVGLKIRAEMGANRC